MDRRSLDNGQGMRAAAIAFLVQVKTFQIGDKIDLAVDRIHRQCTCALFGRQVLDDGITVSDILADDGEAAKAASVSGVDAAAGGVEGNGVGAGADDQVCDQLAGIGVEYIELLIVTGDKESQMIAIDGEALWRTTVGGEVQPLEEIL